jgi:hypothetical protein
MKEWKAILILTATFSVFIYSCIAVSNCYLEYDEVCADRSSTLFVRSVYLCFIALCFTVSPLLRSSKNYLLSSLLNFIGWLSVGAMLDDLFAQDPSVVSSFEYKWAIFSLIAAICNFFSFKPLSILWNFLKNLVCKETK